MVNKKSYLALGNEYLRKKNYNEAISCYYKSLNDYTNENLMIRVIKFNIDIAFRKNEICSISQSLTEVNLLKNTVISDTCKSHKHEQGDTVVKYIEKKVITDASELASGALGRLKPLFDKEFYLSQIPNHLQINDPYEHYLNKGLASGLIPNKKVGELRAQALKKQPLISVLVPTYNTPRSILLETIHSILNQTYGNLEVLVYDDASNSEETRTTLVEIQSLSTAVDVFYGESNIGISNATNILLKKSQGEFIALVDHDDLLLPTALYEIALQINSEEDCDVIYTDHAYIDSHGEYVKTHAKPGWSPFFFKGVMYIGHLLVVKRKIAIDSGGFNPNYDYVQDFEFMLRVSELTHNICHIPKVLYKWRQIDTSVAGGGKKDIDFSQLQEDSVNEHLRRLGKNYRAQKNLRFPHRQVLVPLDIHDRTIDVFLISKTHGIGHKKINFVRTQISVPLLQSDLNFNEKWDFGMVAERITTRAADYVLFIDEGYLGFYETTITDLMDYIEFDGVACVAPLLIGEKDEVLQDSLSIKSIENTFLALSENSNNDQEGKLVCVREVHYLQTEFILFSTQLIPQNFKFKEGLTLKHNIFELQKKLRQKGLANLLIPANQIKKINEHDDEKDKSYLSSLLWGNLNGRSLLFKQMHDSFTI
jgi:glycosyltransferase involved in cell wall biosynthesis